MKGNLFRAGSAAFNLLAGAVAVIAAAVCYAFWFGADQADRSGELGLFTAGAGLLSLLMPNAVLLFGCKFRVKEMLLFQMLPLVLGAAGYTFFQLVLY